MSDDSIDKLIGKDTKVHCKCTSRAVVIDKHGRTKHKRFHKDNCKYAHGGWIVALDKSEDRRSIGVVPSRVKGV